MDRLIMVLSKILVNKISILDPQRPYSKMSEFSRLLGKSRFSALPKNLRNKNSSLLPKQQLIETRANALSRQEWGLKYSLPPKMKSRYITFNEFDNLEHMVDFETGGSYHWKRQRFQETGLVPTFETPRENPLFFDSSRDTNRYITLASVFEAEKENGSSIKNTLKEVSTYRDEFKNFLLERDPLALKNKSFTPNDLSALAIEFLTKKRNSKPIDSPSKLRAKIKKDGIQGTGGLSYGLKGRLANSPNGVQQKFVGPGRFTNNSVTARVVAYGGFLAEVPNTSSNLQFNKTLTEGRVSREVVVPFSAERAVLNSKGQVTIKADVINKTAHHSISNADFIRTQNKNLKDRKMATKRKAENVQDLLKLIKRNAK